MPLFDHYDWAGVVGVVAVTLLCVLATGSWAISFVLGALIGNGSSYLLRRRASAPERLPSSRMRTRH